MKNKILSTSVFQAVREEHIWHAAEQLADGKVNHKFGESTGYDVIADNGKRLPPKAVFGLSATNALGFELLPDHFQGGQNTVCYRAPRTSPKCNSAAIPE